MSREVYHLTEENKKQFFGQPKVKIPTVFYVENELKKEVDALAKKSGFVVVDYAPESSKHINVKSLYGIYSIPSHKSVMLVDNFTEERAVTEQERITKEWGYNVGDIAIYRNSSDSGYLYEQEFEITRLASKLITSFNCDCATIKLKTPLVRGEMAIWKNVGDWDAHNKKRKESHERYNSHAGPYKPSSPDDLMYFEMRVPLDNLMKPADFNNIEITRKDEVHEILNEGRVATAEGRFDSWYEANQNRFNLKVN